MMCKVIKLNRFDQNLYFSFVSQFFLVFEYFCTLFFFQMKKSNSKYISLPEDIEEKISNKQKLAPTKIFDRL